MPPYFRKVSHLGKNILVVDAFAGPGMFEDGSVGSPLIICEAAEEHAKGKYEAIFINNDQTHHNRLASILERSNFKNARAVHSDSQEVLRELHHRLDEPLTIFLYLDPFGLREVSFDLLRPFTERNPKFSTEIFINLNAPGLHRLAARDAYREDRHSENVRGFHRTLTQVLGGDYWTKWLLADDLTTREKEEKVVEGYRKLLSSTGYLKYTGSCPVQESSRSRVKYYMIFASRHIDAMTLLNDNMLKAFQQHVIAKELKDTLFADLSWQAWRDPKEMERISLDYVTQHPGLKRQQVWELIVQDHFSRFSSSEFKHAVSSLVKENKVYSPTKRPTSKLNDSCVLYPVNTEV